MTISLKRAYETAKPADGYRILVERLWPRGLSKAKAKIDSWAKELAPSTELRKWYAHDPEKWTEFKKRYFKELNQQKGAVEDFEKQIQKKKVTFIFGSKEEHLNSAEALKEYLSQTKSKKKLH